MLRARAQFILLVTSLLIPFGGQSLGAQNGKQAPEARESDEPSHAVAYRQGRIAFRKMNFSDAIEQFSKAIEEKPSFADAYNQRGLVFIRIGRYREAVADFSRALKQVPDHTRSLHNRGYALMKAGRLEQAIVDLTAALEKDPEYQSALHNRGTAYLRLEKFKKAIRDFDRSLEIEPTYFAYANKARALAVQEKFAKAIHVLDRAVEQFPESAVLYRTRAGYHQVAGNEKKAKRDLKKFRSLVAEDDDAEGEEEASDE